MTTRAVGADTAIAAPGIAREILARGAGWRLTEHEVATYHQAGLIKPELRLDATILAELRDALERLLADNPQHAPEALVCPHIDNGKPGGAEQAERWFKLCTQPDILNLVEQLIGPDIILWGSQVFCKPARTGRFVPWHQDGKYWPMRPLAACSVWIAIDDADRANGCMRYVPGSHRRGALHQHRLSVRNDVVLAQEVVPGEFNEADARYDELAAGEFSLHDVYLIHGSEANQSARRRAGFVIRYMPASSVFERELGGVTGKNDQPLVRFDFSRRPLWLLRGRDTSGRNDFHIGHDETYARVPRGSDEEFG